MPPPPVRDVCFFCSFVRLIEVFVDGTKRFRVATLLAKFEINFFYIPIDVDRQPLNHMNSARIFQSTNFNRTQEMDAQNAAHIFRGDGIIIILIIYNLVLCSGSRSVMTVQ